MKIIKISTELEMTIRDFPEGTMREQNKVLCELISNGYRIYCGKLSEKDKRRYKVIKLLYISKQSMNITEISKKFSVSKVTIYEDLKIAKERLSSLFFGIDGLRFF